MIKKINRYCLLNDDQPERKELFIELRRNLYSPALVASCDFIPPEHPLMKDAITLSDGFEALTNGMFNEEALQDVKKISSTSLLAPWSALISGVHRFYASDYEGCLNDIEGIEEDTAPALFKPFFSALLNSSGKLPSGSIVPDTASPEALSQQWKELKESILENTRVIDDSLDLIQEAVSMEDLLLDTAGLLVRDIIKEDRESACRILLWCFEQLQVKDMLSDRAVSKGRSLFGDRDGYRLAALASISFDPDRSLLYWLHSLQAFLDSRNTDRNSVQAYLSIIRDMAESVEQEFELTEEYIQLTGSLVSDIAESIGHIYPELPETRDLPEDPFRAIRQLCGEQVQPQPQRKVREVKTAAVQLELFAF
ncbi:MAG: hypothetical protein PQJ50_05475 [Spirochaetales bacterium]|nr:hypothetical protein [Spirochaetales bacterium]